MSSESPTGSLELLRRALAGDAAALEQLLCMYRDRLRRLIAMRMDPRVRVRVDPSDVVQDSLTKAAERIDQYPIDADMVFYAWLRQIACERLAAIHRAHLETQKRSVLREAPSPPRLPDDSIVQLASRFATSSSGPSTKASRKETQARVRAALEQLPDHYREVLVMRHLEQLSVEEMASVLNISTGAVKMRCLRATNELRIVLARQIGKM